MLDVALLLGPVEFRSLEIPSQINFGGAQRLAVHQLLGGQRVIDALGRNDGEILFNGTFSGTDASLRARLVDELRSAGNPLPLVWDVFFFTVLIAQFEAEYQNPGWVPYRIRCTVLRDEASAAANAVLSLAASALADATAATGLAGAAGLDLTSALTAVTAPGATVRGTAAYVSAQSATGTATASLRQGIASSGAALDQPPVVGAQTADQGIFNLTTAVGAAQQVASLTAAYGYLGRVSTNLANAST